LADLGAVARQERDVEAARSYFQQALDINRATLGPEHPRVAATLADLGAVARQEGDLQAARSYFQQALDINLRALGPKHETTELLTSNLEEIREMVDGDLSSRSPYMRDRESP
jgi:tetratricopeptide (TPR) repeat protein